ncbi:hypothetical protein C8J57DRAFT_1280184 [Mycena rebaudengoi]|nr:hypothetical protein C8J57DRAFT_1280184 [Mycena rebaudengoi]
MPVATSRRKKPARRQASSDIEDEATQGRTARDEVDEDEDEDDAPSRVKKEKTARQEGKGSCERKIGSCFPKRSKTMTDDEDDRIDIDNFADQPLTKADTTKINGLMADWQAVEGAMHQNAAIISHVAVSMAEVSNGEEGQESLEELDRVMKGLIDVRAVLNEILQAVARGDEDITDASNTYLMKVDEMNAEYDKKTTRQKYAKNPQYIEYKELLYEVDHTGQAMPPITDFIPREPGDESDDDDDVVMGGVTQEYKCPLMMTILEDPLTSSVCKHSFSGAAIRGLFGSNRGQKKCPAAGCSKSFTLAQCLPNKDLERRIKAYNRRMAKKAAQEDSDAEEVID